MHPSSALVCALALSFAAPSHGQATSDGFLAALNAAGLTSFASIVSNAFMPRIVQRVQAGTARTVFAPTNAALAAANISASNITLAVADAMYYHALAGSFPSSSLPTSGNGIARTLLTEGVNLPGNQSQVMVLGQLANGTTQVRQGLSNATVSATTTYQGVTINTIDSVLSVPASLSATATAAGLSSLALSLEGVLPGLITMLETIPGLTVFAPVNDAFNNLPGLLSSIPSATIQNVLSAHVLNGTVLYSPSITNNGVAIAASGAQLGFINNSTGIYIQGANSTAKVLIPDVPVANGVVHVIDRVIVTYMADNAAAQAAIASRSSEAAGQTAPQTGLVSQLLPTSIAAPPSQTATRSGADRRVPALVGLPAAIVAAMLA